ncbi:MULTISPECIES: methyltransferase domain-containing protein [Protofrankia]|uniref:Protein-L-isoaspartate O-methyltransferase n=1 Tax=Candidatus Protofrankia datiscae TaxID=2716812 RepID=F8AY44_9ACTN|nr:MULTISPECIES: methyltransferase domain-containing protein [Protofrankia]AEH08548.1 protein-L-isoaspartate(D-aspartate) O-methyltransferase [Candidatus Protofrankia datiscae]
MAVRRAAFVPDTIWVDGPDGWMVPLRRDDDPETWSALAESSDPVAIQVDDGERPDKGILPTSSNTAAWLVDRMLTLLNVREGMDVLEIGTGTGYNAALLAERTRTGRVTTIEIDPTIAGHARQALRRNNYPVTVIIGDGILGYPERAPYDRIIATAAAATIPYAWVEQTRPAGRILLPLAATFHHGALLAVTVHGDGTAHGRFHGEAPFIRLRNHRPTRFHRQTADGARVTTTQLYPRQPFTDFDAGFAIGTRLPDCITGQRGDDDTATLLLSHPASRSWASLTPGTTAHEVRQYGPRRLWDDLETAYRWWTDAGRPDHTRIGITVTPEGQTFWLDTPEHPLPAIQGPAV